LDTNVKVLFGSGIFSAFILGVFELLFPFYLEYRGVSLVGMGLIFSISTLLISFLRIFLGEYADVYGRKKVYLASSAVGVVAKSVFPFSAHELPILVSKFLDDLEANLRMSVHNLMLYENARKAYAKLFSWFTAANFIFQAMGNLSFAFLLVYFGYSNFFFLLATLEAVRFFILPFYTEAKKEKPAERISLREAYSFRFGRNLTVLSLSSAVGALGFGIAHGFLLPLYFVGKLGLDAAQISVVTAVHRLSFLTTPVAHRIIGRLGLRRTYILSISAYAVSFLTVGLVSLPVAIFVPIFLIHDLLGGGIGMTAMNVIMQDLIPDGTRGRQSNTFNAVQTPMVIIAPSIAGILAARSWDLIFIAGGLLYVASLLVFCLFFKSEDRALPSTELKT